MNVSPSEQLIKTPAGSVSAPTGSVSTPGSPVSSSPIAADAMPLRSADAIDLEQFNALAGDSYISSDRQPVEDMQRLFVKQVILDDETTMDVATIQVPGFIGITNSLDTTDADGNPVSGHADIARFLERDGLHICTYQWHKERYGTPIDTRSPLPDEIFKETFIKNEGHHAGAIVPARRYDAHGQRVASFGTFNSPASYHEGLYGDDGYVAVTQRLVFPEFVKGVWARGYTNSIICWMAVLNPFTSFPGDYNGSDPTGVIDRPTLREFLRNGLLASLGDADALEFFSRKENMVYCAEFMYVSLNTVLFPFNKATLTELLDGDAAKAMQVLALRDQHNREEVTSLSLHSGNPEFRAFTIEMPPVPDDLPPLDQLMRDNGQDIAPESLPLQPFRISQLIRRAFHTLLPRQEQVDNLKVVQARTRLLRFMEPALLEQMGLGGAAAEDPRVMALSQYVESVCQSLDRPFATYEEFNQVVDALMQQADEMLVAAGDRTHYVPPRIYVDLGQNDDAHLPKGWGFHLETVGALICRSVIHAA